MAVEVVEHERFRGVYWAKLEDGSRRLATENLAPGKTVYREKLVRFGGKEYRLWDSYRSKLAASIVKDISNIYIEPRHRVLYLGAATGTTASHVSDIVGKEGKVFCVEFAPRVFRELLNNVCAFRQNMFPILADARFPERYRHLVTMVDDIYCDIAQPEQAKVVIANARMFLRLGGGLLLAVKARSIDVTKTPTEVFRREIEILESGGFEVEDVAHLEPFDRDHVMVAARYRGGGS